MVRPQSPKRFYRRKRIVLPVALLLASILALLIANVYTPRPAAYLIRFAAEHAAKPQPAPETQAIMERTVRIAEVAYSGEGDPNGTMDIYTPRNPQGKLPIIVWIHGGGFILGDKSDAAEYARHLADQGFLVANINYALAPGTRYPGPVMQANEAIRYLLAHAPEYGGDTGRFFLGGNSAGAQIASQTAALTTNPQLAAAMQVAPAIPADSLKGAVLFCGIYNMDTVHQGRFPGMRTYLWSYTGVKDYLAFPAIDQLSTVRQITAAYPPVFISAGDADPLTYQSKELVAALEQHKVPVVPLFFDDSPAGLGHDYQYRLTEPAAAVAFQQVIGFLKEQSGAQFRQNPSQNP